MMKQVLEKTIENSEIKQEKNKSDIVHKLNIGLVVFIILVILAMQLILIVSNSVDADEAFTMLTVKEEWNAFWEKVVKDVHPPLYYIILKGIMSFAGYNLQVAKIVSILPILLTNIIISYLTLKDKKRASDKKTGILLAIFIIATTLTSNFLYMSVEIRMYSWAIFFVTMSGIYAYKVYNDTSKKNMALFVIFSLLAGLTHYFSLIMECVIYLYLFIMLFLKDKKYIKNIGIISIITILIYSLWLPNAIMQFKDVNTREYWITFNKGDIVEYITSIFNVNIAFTIAILMFIAIGIGYKLFIKKDLKSDEKKEVKFALLAMSLPFMIILIAVILNIAIKPIFVSRYMIPSLGLFWLGIIILLKHIDYKNVGTLLIRISSLGYEYYTISKNI